MENESENSLLLEDGEYTIEVTLEGGSGRAQITSPAELMVEAGEVCARIEWSSSHYDYMKVDGEMYLPVNEEGNSVFEIPVGVFDEPIEVVADTTAMSRPHEVEYTLIFDSASVVASGSRSGTAAMGVVLCAVVLLAVAAAGFAGWKKRKHV